MKKVLDVGQCDLDNSLISDMLKKHFDVQVDRAKSFDDAVEAIRSHGYDLVLVNRLLDLDRSEGLAIVQAVKSDDATESTPVMIVSNFDDVQQVAVAAGAEAGFGTAALSAPATVKLLEQYLAERC